MGRLGFMAKRSARVAAGIASVLMEEGETTEQLIHGKFLGEDAVAVVCGDRVLVVNDREWKPDIRSISLSASLTVQGMGDDKSASLTISGDDEPVEITGIDPAQAREFAHRIRTRVAGG